MANLIRLQENEMKALTWKDDIKGLVCEDKGETISIYYALMPDLYEMEMSKADFNAIIYNTTEKLN